MAPAASLSRTRTIGGTGAILAAACVWTFVSAAASGGDPLPVVAVIAASGGAFLAGAGAGRWRPWIVPATVLAAALVVAAASGSEVVSSRPAQGPFGYSNATGAFYVQATIAGLMLAGTRRELRWIGWVGAATVALIALAVRSTAAGALLAVVLAAAAASSVATARRTAVAALAALFAIALGGTVLVGALSVGSAAGVPGEGIFDPTRKTLWHEAVTTIGEHPLTGVGPGRFSETAPLARIDADARRAHHGFLQVGAETGVMGMGLAVLAFAWPLASLATRSEPAPLAVLGAAALAALGIGACVDYLLHFPAIPVTAAALAGTATSYDNA